MHAQPLVIFSKIIKKQRHVFEMDLHSSFKPEWITHYCSAAKFLISELMHSF